MKDYNQIKSYGETYRVRSDGGIVNRKIKRKLIFVGPEGQRQKKEIFYNLALYRLSKCPAKYLANEEDQASYDEVTFKKIMPIIENYEKLIRENYQNGVLDISTEQLMALKDAGDPLYKYVYEAISMLTCDPIVLKGIIDYILDTDLDYGSLEEPSYGLRQIRRIYFDTNPSNTLGL